MKCYYNNVVLSPQKKKNLRKLPIFSFLFSSTLFLMKIPCPKLTIFQIFKRCCGKSSKIHDSCIYSTWYSIEIWFTNDESNQYEVLNVFVWKFSHTSQSEFILWYILISSGEKIFANVIQRILSLGNFISS